ncbi:Glutaredoxin-2 [Serratia marcescens]|uniref:Glutaredoxin-2 n=1 Tax=Serratia marcescens TaxID=615 RepID=A0A379ZB15_SERMA|nr:Glutaredoxin-2 [Serratia marcescens]
MISPSISPNSADLIAQLEADLQTLSPLIVSAEAVNGELSEDDIHLFPLLRSLSIVAGVALPDNVETYRNRMGATQRSAVAAGHGTITFE